MSRCQDVAMGYDETYKEKHRHPVNRACHYVGIPMIVASLGVVFFHWKIALGLFVAGWIFQFIGHAFEGNRPAFFKNPLYLLVGPWHFAKRLFR